MNLQITFGRELSLTLSDKNIIIGNKEAGGFQMT